MKSLTLSILALSLVLFTYCNGSNAQSEKTSLSPQEFSQKMAEMPEAQLIDVRTMGEFQGGFIAGAHNIDWNGDAFEKQAAELDKSKPVLVYCLSGGRSAAAADHLRNKGFNVYELEGGLMQWRAAKLPETTDGAVKQSGMGMEDLDAAMRADKLVVVDFFAEWCAPCKRMEPYLKRLEKDMNGSVQLIRIDADKNPELCQQLNVSSLPVIQIYKDKRKVWETLGFIGEEDLKAQLKALE